MNDLTEKYLTLYETTGKAYNPNLLFLESEIKRYRYLNLQGGTRSGKTHAILRWIIRLCTKHGGMSIDIVRETLTSLRGSAMNDFFEILTEAGLYDDKYHDKTHSQYLINGNTIRFFGADEEQKLRGWKRDILYCNEVNELEWPTFKQLRYRTSGKIISDFNPSMPEDHWMFENIFTDQRAAYIVSTYAHNPHLSVGQIEDIEWDKENDPESWIIYGLGQRGEIKGQVYKHIKKLKAWSPLFPSAAVVDFGFSNDPTVIGEFMKHNRTIYGRELFYETGVTNMHIGFMLALLGFADKPIIADSAEQKSCYEIICGWADVSIETVERLAFELKREITDERKAEILRVMRKGFSGLVGASKGPESVRHGIDLVKAHEVLITEDSHNGWKEIRQYRWKVDPVTGRATNVPVDKHNHFLDDLRYFAMDCDSVL